MPTTRVTPIREQIADHIRSDVISGSLAPNTKLSEQTLADRFGVSRGPVRDVLLQLTKEGLLVSKNNCGVSVNCILSPELQALMVDIRLQMERYAIKTIINELNETDFQELGAILEQIPAAFNIHDFTQITKLDIDFHHHLIKRAGGDELSNLWLPIVIRMRMNYRRIDNAEACVAEHQRILDALKAKNIESAIEALTANIK